MHLILLLLLFATPTFAATDLSELAQSPKWIRLLHYKKNTLGNYVSEADSANFFLHEKGKTSPERELRKAVEVFFL